MNCPSSEKLIDQVVRAEKLPSPPSVALKILELDRSESSSLADLTKVISADPTLTAKLIKYCNSPLVGTGREIASINQAVVMLGKRAVQMLALSFSLVDSESVMGCRRFEEFWSRSLATAVASQVVCKQTADRHDEAFIVGLLGNIGQLAVMILLPEVFDEIQQLVSMQSQKDIQSASAAVLGISFSEISSAVLKQWSFPAVVADAVSRVHWPEQHEGRFDCAIYVAERMSRVPFAESEVEAIDSFRAAAIEYLHFNEQEQDNLFEKFVQSWRDYAALLSLDASCADSLKEIELAAKERLVSLTMEMHRENDELASQRDELSKAAVTDLLTGLGNRRAFEQRGQEELARSARNQRPFVLLVADIDHFKALNDTHGHQAGDTVLKCVATIIASHVRQYDVAFRYGGEEFALILPECSLEMGCQVAERLRRAVEKCAVPIGGAELKCTISIGASFADNPGNSTLEQLFAEADKRLYQAKKQGRNCIVAPSDRELTEQSGTEIV